MSVNLIQQDLNEPDGCWNKRLFLALKALKNKPALFRGRHQTGPLEMGTVSSFKNGIVKIKCNYEPSTTIHIYRASQIMIATDLES